MRKLVLAFLTMFISCVSVLATGSAGTDNTKNNGDCLSRKTIFKEDFGEFDYKSDPQGYTYKYWDYSDLNNPVQRTKTVNTPYRTSIDPAPLGCTFQTSGPVEDGEYCVAGYLTSYATYNGINGSRLEWAARIGGDTHTKPIYTDHSGDYSGCALFVNCPAYSGGQSVYSKTLTLSPDQTFYCDCYFSVFTNSSTDVNTYVPVNISIKMTEVGNESNTAIVSGSATNTSEGGTGTWVTLSDSLSLTKTGVLKIEIINNVNTNAKDGNDLVIDDITLTACSSTKIDSFTVSAVAEENLGGVEGSGRYAEGEVAHLSATDYYGYHFLKWSTGDTSRNLDIVVTQDTDIVAYFVPDYCTIEVLSAGNGNVSGTGYYKYGTTVKAVAVPRTGYKLLSWSNGETANPLSVTLTQDTSLTATFVLDTFAVKVLTSGGEGTVKGAGNYTYRKVANISATPAYGYHFVKWSTGSTKQSFRYTVKKDTTFIAYFAPDTFNIQALAVNGSASGSGKYAYGTTAKLSATTDKEGYRFDRWDNDEYDASFNLTVTSDSTVTAYFVIDSFSVSLSVSGSGVVSGAGNYLYGTTAHLTATPNTGYHFVNWSNGSTSAEMDTIVRSDIALKANFAIDTFDVNLTSDGHGTVQGAGRYAYNKSVTLTATPNAGYHFVNWSNGSTQLSYTIRVRQDTSLTAYFALDSFVIEASAINGMVSGSGTYAYGDTAHITATPKSGYTFYSWSNGVTTTSFDLVVMSDSSVIATFALDTLTVSLASDGHGTVRGAGRFAFNKIVTVSAVPNTGYHFVRWSDGSENQNYTFRVRQDTSLTAYFVLDSFSLEAVAVNGTATGSGDYCYGQTAHLTSSATEGYHFNGWSNGAKTQNIDVIVKSDTSLIAYYSADTFVVSGVAVNGSVSGTGTYDYGTTVTVKAVPAKGYHFVQWSTGATDKTLSFKIYSDTTFTAYFAVDSFKVALSSVGSGSTSGAGIYAYGDTATVFAVPTVGNHFSAWSNGEIDSVLNVTVLSDTSLTAYFDIDTFYVIGLATHGTISGQGAYAYGETATLKAIPATGYHFVAWSTGETSATFDTIVRSNIGVMAGFVVDTFTVTLNKVGEGSVVGAGRYTYNKSVTLQARPADGYRFDGWSDGVTASIRILRVRQDTVLTAKFVVDTFVVNALAVNGKTTGSGNYLYGDTATLTIQPNAGYHFSGWSNGSTDTTISVIVKSDLTFTAYCAVDSFAVSAVAQNGSVQGTGLYAYGSTANLTATANEGYRFVSWSDGSTSENLSLTVYSDTTVTAKFVIDTFTVSVVSDRNGTVSGGGRYVYYTTATLHAVPAEGYHFVKWSNGSTRQNYTIRVTKDSALTAYFALDTFMVVGLASNGTIAGQGIYFYGDTATLTAIPNTGYHFVGWSTGETATSFDTIVHDNIGVIAIFAVDSFKVTLDTIGQGTVIGAGTYPYNKTVTLQARPSVGYHFAGWSDGVSSATRSIRVRKDTALTAKFAIDTFIVNALAVNGTATGSGSYVYGATAKLSASTNTGYHFKGWDNGATETTISIVVTSDTTLTAGFGLDTLHVSAVAQNGQVTGTGAYKFGATAALTAVPDEGYHFVKWNTGASASALSFKVYNDTALTAYFAIDTFEVSLTSNGNGEVSGAGIYTYGDTATVVATPVLGYHFCSWSNGVTDSLMKIRVVKDSALKANFAIDSIYVVGVAVANGSVLGSGMYLYGDTVTLVAVPNYGYHFRGWSNRSTKDTLVVIATQNTGLGAYFFPDTFSVTLDTVGAGTVTGAGRYAYNKTVTLQAVPATGYHFLQWSNGSFQRTYTIRVTKDTALTAIFAIDTFNVTAIANNGTVTGSGLYVYGDSASLSAKANVGYHFEGWSNGATDTDIKIQIVSDSVLTADFVADTFVVNAIADNGTVTGIGIYKYGTTATLTAYPVEGYHFVGWSDGSTSRRITYKVTADTTFTAYFAIDTFNVALAVKGQGTVGGEGRYLYGDTAHISAEAEKGYHFTEWNDGVKADTRDIQVMSDTALTAYFVIDSFSINALASDGGKTTGSGVYAYGDKAVVVAWAADHYHFTAWSNGEMNSEIVIPVYSDSIVTAYFAVDSFNVLAEAVGEGSVEGAGRYEYNAEATFTAKADSGYHFAKWSTGSTDTALKYTVEKDTLFTAYFEKDSIIVPDTIVAPDTTVAPITQDTTIAPINPDTTKSDTVVNDTIKYMVDVLAENGTVSGTGYYVAGDTATLVAKADSGYHFSKWSTGSSLDTLRYAVNADSVFTAYFDKDSVIPVIPDTVVTPDTTVTPVTPDTTIVPVTPDTTVTPITPDTTIVPVTPDTIKSDTIVNDTIKYMIDVLAENGTVSGTGYYVAGDTATLIAKSDSGYHFTKWSTGSSLDTLRYVVKNDTVFTAYFAKDSSVAPVIPDTTIEPVNPDTTVTPVNPDTTITPVSPDTTVTPVVPDTTVEPITPDTTKSDTIVNDTIKYMIDVLAENGTVSGTGYYVAGDTATLIAVADSGYHFTKWSTGSSLDTLRYAVKSDTVFTAYFAKDSSVTPAIPDTTIEPVNPDTIVTPVNPDTTITPVVPDTTITPVTPDTTVTPIEPDTTITPVEPDTTVTPVVPDTTVVPVNPDTTVTPVEPDTTVAPVNPDSTITPVEPDTIVEPVNPDTTITPIFPDTIIIPDDEPVAATYWAIQSDSTDTTMGYVVGVGKFREGTVAILIAQPVSPMIHFVRWSDGDTSSVKYITMEKDTVVTPIFDYNETQVETEDLVNVYNMNGKLLRLNISREKAVNGLPRGVYIIRTINTNKAEKFLKWADYYAD